MLVAGRGLAPGATLKLLLLGYERYVLEAYGVVLTVLFSYIGASSVICALSVVNAKCALVGVNIGRLSLLLLLLAVVVLSTKYVCSWLTISSRGWKLRGCVLWACAEFE